MQRPLSLSALALLVSMFAAAAPGPTAMAQDANEAALAPPDVFLLELRRRSRGNRVQRAESIRDALRLRLDEEAGSFLEALAGRELGDADRARMVQIISGDQLLRVATDEAFSAAARQQAAELLAGQRRFLEDSQRITAAIAALGSGVPDQELPAYRTLLAAGVKAIGPLALAAAGEAEEARRDDLLRVLARLGEESLAALSQLALYGDDDLRAGALVSLARLRAEAALPFLGVATYAAAASERERQVAQQQLRARYTALPTRQEIEQYLLLQMQQQRVRAGQLDKGDATAVSWLWDAEARSLSPTTTTAGLAAQRRVADFSRLLHRLGNLSREASRLGLSADLAYRYQLDPLTVIEQADELRALWGPAALDAASLSEVIAAALQEDDLAAAVAAITLVDDATGGNPADLMTTHSALPAPLVQAVSHSVPQVRYEAAAAIARLRFSQPYAGSSTVVRRWIEMATLHRDAVALVVETRAGLQAQIEGLIASLGYRVEVVSSVREAVAAVDRGGDLRLLITTTVLPDRSVLELVDAVRRHPLGLRIPIFIHGAVDPAVLTATEQARWAAPVIHMELPASVAGWGLELGPVIDQRLGRLQGLEPLTTVQRDDFRRGAALAIGHLASHPDVYHFYDFTLLAQASLGVSPVIADEVANVAFGQPRLALLSASASAASQTAMAEMLLQGSWSAERYQAISEALQFSLARNGVLLPGEVLRRLGDASSRLAQGPQRAAILELLQHVSGRLAPLPVAAEEVD